MAEEQEYVFSSQELASIIFRFTKYSTSPEFKDEFRHRQFHFLITLSKLIKPGEKGIKPSMMSDVMHITRGAITHIVNEMEAEGLLERIPDPLDRRVVLIAITSEGQKMLDDTYQRFMTRMNTLIDYLGEEDSRELGRLLSKSLAYMIEEREKRKNNLEHNCGEEK
jgi:DNA-binding MarR family transcriptional regulator